MMMRDRTAWLHGGQTRCVHLPPNVWRTWRLVLLGPPGVGKGTQGEMLSAALGACPLSTGDVLRAARDRVTGSTSTMAEVRSLMQRGELVPDEIILDLVRERRRCLTCRGGFMLDGFPRTLTQAHGLERLLDAEGLSLDAVINYEVSPSVLTARVAGRRMCVACNAVYHLDWRPPRGEGICDRCGGALMQRGDDDPEAVQTRLKAYEAATTPLFAYYQHRRLLVTVSADSSPGDILAHTLDALTARRIAM
jgi:adenylate kinase